MRSAAKARSKKRASKIRPHQVYHESLWTAPDGRQPRRESILLLVIIIIIITENKDIKRFQRRRDWLRVLVVAAFGWCERVDFLYSSSDVDHGCMLGRQSNGMSMGLPDVIRVHQRTESRRPIQQGHPWEVTIKWGFVSGHL